MNVNIALNTIIIIMVFLFPGVLFRKFYFSGKFGNQFEQGNLLERFLWSLFLSVICLGSVACIFFFIDYLFGIKPLENVNFKSLSNIFKDLSINQFPKNFEEEKSFIDFLLLLLAVYIISGGLGFTLKKIVLLFSIDKLSVFKFKNSWHYLSQAYKENGVNRKIGDVHTTFVDVLVKNNSKEELYRGILHDFILDKEDKLENIVLSNAYKFIKIDKEEKEKLIESIEESISKNEGVYTLHKEYYDKKVFKKSIEGNLLVLSKENIININFTYVNTSNKVATYKRYFYNMLRFFFVIGCLLLLVLPFLELNIYFLNSIAKKVVFSFTLFFIFSYIINLIVRLFKLKLYKNNLNLVDFIFMVLLLFSPFLWLLDFFSIFWTIFTFISLIFLFSIFSPSDSDN